MCRQQWNRCAPVFAQRQLETALLKRFCLGAATLARIELPRASIVFFLNYKMYVYCFHLSRQVEVNQLTYVLQMRDLISYEVHITQAQNYSYVKLN